MKEQKKRKMILMLLISISMLHPAFAKDLGVMGETYPIVEIDFLEFIQSRAATFQQTGQWQNLQNKIQQDAIQYRDRPKRVSGISRAQNTKSWLFDPSIRLDH